MTTTPEPLYILGAGMHPWGKWGRDFTEYGVVAARAALAEAGLDWTQIQLVAARTRSATAIRVSLRARHSRRSSAGTAYPSVPAMRRAPAVPRRCRARGRTSWPDSATSLW